MTAGKPLLVGGFVLGGVALGVISILIFAGTGLFSRSINILAVFPGSVSGLAVGSPATFRGAKVGEVKSMKVVVNATDDKPVVYVYINIDSDTIERAGHTKPLDVSGIREEIEGGIKKGLRAQLTSVSFVTGQLSVDFDYHPDAPVILAGGGEDGVLEVPAIPTDLQELRNQFIAMNLPDLSTKARDAMVSIQRVVEQVGGQIPPLSEGAQQTLGDARITLRTITGAVDKIQVNAARTLGNLDQLVIEARKQVTTDGSDADKLVTSLNDMIGPRSPIREDLGATLRDLAASASSLRTFMRDFERSPSGTLLGKGSK
jgi:paraquat-inducible protein B